MRRIPLLALILVAAACAQVGRPPGGPVDDVPPVLQTVEPGSLLVGVASDEALVFHFSEKVERRGFERSLTLVPEVPLARPRFEDLAVRVRPATEWPADTVVVWTLAADLRDKHGVRMGEPRQGVITRSERLPPGVITGRARYESPDTDKPVDWVSLRAALTLPATEGSRRPRPWRSAPGDETGVFRLLWLDVPSGPFDLQVWLDRNANGARDEREPVAALDSLFLAGPDSILTIEEEQLVLVDLEAPVPLVFCLLAVPADSSVVRVWVRHEEARRPQTAEVDTSRCSPPLMVEPGRFEWGAWIDLDADGRFGPDSTGVSEPWLAVREGEMLPAVPETLSLSWPDSTLPWAVIDTLRTTVVPDELVAEPTPSEGP